MGVRWHPTTAEIAFAILLVILPLGFSDMPVVWKCVCFALTWVLSLHLGFTFIPFLASRPTFAKIVLLIGMSGLLVGLTYPRLLKMWREEMAAAPEGDLRGAGEILDDGLPHALPNVEIGNSGVVFHITPLQQPGQKISLIKFFYDSRLRVEYGKKGPLVSTPVRDRFGNLVVEINQNHWKMYPPYCSDKNYTKDALEVLDSSGHVVFQIKLLSDGVQVQGEWWDDQGRGERLIAIKTADHDAEMIPLWSQNQRNDRLVRPMFKYPSKDFWGRFDN
ncbi:MAG: hypothetical protein WA674_07525 [Candidatus Acidiferrales bacterium]